MGWLFRFPDGWPTAEYPVADLRVFGQFSFAAAAVANSALTFVMYGSQRAISLWLQTLMGYPSLKAGVAMVALVGRNHLHAAGVLPGDQT